MRSRVQLWVHSGDLIPRRSFTVTPIYCDTELYNDFHHQQFSQRERLWQMQQHVIPNQVIWALVL
jgi:hypothetical protein